MRAWSPRSRPMTDVERDMTRILTDPVHGALNRARGLVASKRPNLPAKAGESGGPNGGARRSRGRIRSTAAPVARSARARQLTSQARLQPLPMRHRTHSLRRRMPRRLLLSSALVALVLALWAVLPVGSVAITNQQKLGELQQQDRGDAGQDRPQEGHRARAHARTSRSGPAGSAGCRAGSARCRAARARSRPTSTAPRASSTARARTCASSAPARCA